MRRGEHSAAPPNCATEPFSRKQQLRAHVPERSEWEEGGEGKKKNHMFSGMFGFVVGERWEVRCRRHEIRGGGGDGRNKFEDCLCWEAAATISERKPFAKNERWLVASPVPRQAGGAQHNDIKPPRSLLLTSKTITTALHLNYSPIVYQTIRYVE